MQHGVIEGVRHPIPGEAYVPVVTSIDPTLSGDDKLNALYDWVNVAVTDYLEQNNRWAVLTLDGLQRVFHLPRIYVEFKAEDPDNFARRMKAAIKLREYTENRIR